MNNETDELWALVVKRQARLEQDRDWSEYNDGQVADAMAELDLIQHDMLGINFAQRSNLLVGLKLLLEGDDQPNFADDFKNQPFSALRAAITFYDGR